MKHPLEHELDVREPAGVREENGVAVLGRELSVEERIDALVGTEARAIVDADEAHLVALGIPLEVVDDETARLAWCCDRRKHGSHSSVAMLWVFALAALAGLTAARVGLGW